MTDTPPVWCATCNKLVATKAVISKTGRYKLVTSDGVPVGACNFVCAVCGTAIPPGNTLMRGEATP